jgi:hypothetical protein
MEASEGNRYSLLKATAENLHDRLDCRIMVLVADTMDGDDDLSLRRPASSVCWVTPAWSRLPAQGFEIDVISPDS